MEDRKFLSEYLASVETSASENLVIFESLKRLFIDFWSLITFRLLYQTIVNQSTSKPCQLCVQSVHNLFFEYTAKLRVSKY